MRAAVSALAYLEPPVMVLVLVIALLNLGLGFGLAVALKHAPPVSWKWRVRLPKFSRKAHAPAAPAVVAAPPEPAAPTPAPTPKPVAAVPPPKPAATVDVSQLLPLFTALAGPLDAARGTLMDADERLRARELDADVLESLAAELQSIQQDWLAKCTAPGRQLDEWRGRLGDLNASVEPMADLLAQLRRQMEEDQEKRAAIDTANHTDFARRRYLSDVGRLLGLTHALGDALQEAKAACLAALEQLHTLSEDEFVDAAMGQPNRLGLERLWLQRHESGSGQARPLCCALLDIDRTYSLNERLGSRFVDELLSALGGWIAAQLRSGRGHDQLARITGQSVLLFLDDTNLEDAITAVERIRQTIAATTFALEDESLELMASCGVALVLPDETTGELLGRLRGTVRHAKQGGRNRASLADGSDIQAIAPRSLPVKPQMVRLTSGQEAAL